MSIKKNTTNARETPKECMLKPTGIMYLVVITKNNDVFWISGLVLSIS